MDHSNPIQIEVVYAKLKRQAIIPLTLKKGSTVLEAVQQSGVLALLDDDEIKTLEDRLGIFGERVSLSRELKEGDRVEVYRSLIKDPKEARKERAAADLRVRSTIEMLTPSQPLDRA